MEHKANFDSYILNPDPSGAISICITFNVPFPSVGSTRRLLFWHTMHFSPFTIFSRTYFSCYHKTGPIESLLAIFLVLYSTHFLETNILFSTSIRSASLDCTRMWSCGDCFSKSELHHLTKCHPEPSSLPQIPRFHALSWLQVSGCGPLRYFSLNCPLLLG